MPDRDGSGIFSRRRFQKIIWPQFWPHFFRSTKLFFRALPNYYKDQGADLGFSREGGGFSKKIENFDAFFF